MPWIMRYADCFVYLHRCKRCRCDVWNVNAKRKKKEIHIIDGAFFGDDSIRADWVS